MNTSAQPTEPRELMARFVEYVTKQDLDRLVGLYDESAVFVPSPGVVHTGLPSIRKALEALLSLGPVMETRVTEVHETGDIALVIVEWKCKARRLTAVRSSRAGEAQMCCDAGRMEAGVC